MFPWKQTRLEELHRLWDLLLLKTKEKGMRLLQAQKLVQYLRECDDAMDWISDKVELQLKTCSVIRRKKKKSTVFLFFFYKLKCILMKS